MLQCILIDDWCSLRVFCYKNNVNHVSNECWHVETGVYDGIPVKGRGLNPAHEDEGPQPVFDANTNRNVTAIGTQTAFLHCKVKDLGIKLVSVFSPVLLPYILLPYFCQ